MTELTAAPGYYPDPSGAEGLRWWDGVQWTAHTQPLLPVAPPPVSQQSTWLPVPAVLPAAPQTRSRVDKRAAVVAGVIMLALVAGPVGWRARSAPNATPPRAATAVTPGPQVTYLPRAKAPVATTAHGKAGPAGTPVVTLAQAKHVVSTFWTEHERALVARDVTALRRLETGAAALYEPGAVDCGCLVVASPRPVLDAEYYVPRQTRYPAHFVVEAGTAVGSHPWAELLVFTKARPTARWLVAEASGFGPLPGQPASLGTAGTTAEGFVRTPTRSQHRRAVQLARQLAALWQQAKETGQVPAQTRFRTEGQMGARLAQIAAHAQDAVQSNGLFGHMRFFVDPRDPLVEVAEADGSALACQAVRETAAYRPPAGGAIVQDDARQNWGRSLAPGQYATVTNHGAWQTCFLISRNAHAPVIVLNQDVDGGFPTATEASGSGQDQA